MSSLCFAIGCKTIVSKERFGCRPCWRKLPKPFRDEVWSAYNKQDRNRTLELVRDAIKMSAGWLR